MLHLIPSFISGSMLENFLFTLRYVTAKTGKDSDTESENLRLLIRFFVSDSQKTDNSKDVSFIGI